jgi:tetratricopeptide (TPR) repeat protein
LDKQIRQLLDQLAVDPSDTPVFQTLEEQLFLAGAWSELAGVYECRLAAFDVLDPDAVEVRLRLAELLEQRLDDRRGARARLEEIVRAVPGERRALAALRALMARTGDAAGALQVAEMEEQLELAPVERAALLAETGALWQTLGDRTEYERRIEEAFRLDPACDAAARGLAELAAADGRIDDASQIQLRRIQNLTGGARADALEQLARLVEPTRPEQARDLLTDVVREFPERREALERLISLEHAGHEVKRVDALQRALWRCLAEREERVQLALEAGTYQLEEGGAVEAALHWAQAAHEVAPDDARVQQLRARASRRAGQPEALIDALERLVELGEAAPLRMLEIAALHERAGRPASAIDWLARLTAQDPDDEEALALLDRCLERTGQHARRVDVIEHRIALAQTDEASELLAGLGELHASVLDDPDAAESAFRRALERKPGAARALDGLIALLRQSGRYAELAEALDARIEGSRGARRVAAACELGRLLLEQREDPTGAAHAFREALADDPEAAEALAGLRQVALYTGDPALRIEVCERELPLAVYDTRRIALYAELLEIAREAGDLPRAQRTAQLWADLDTDNSTPYFALAELARAAGDKRTEAVALDRLEPLLFEAPERRALVLLRLGEVALEEDPDDGIDQAIDAWSAAAALVPAPELQSRLADLYRRADRSGELIEALFAQMPHLDGEPERAARIELARALMDAGRRDEALGALGPVLSAGPDDPEIADWADALLQQTGDHEQRLELLGTRLAGARDLEQRRALAERQATVLLDALGRPADAIAVLRELADPSRDEALESIFDTALVAAGSDLERASWLAAREPHTDSATVTRLRHELATLQERCGDQAAAIGTLQRAQRDASPGETDAIRERLLDLLRQHGAPEAQLEHLDDLLAQPLAPTAHAAFRIERARLLAEHFDDPRQAVEELERAQRDAPSGPGELRLIAALCARTGAHAARRRALEQLAAATPDAAEARRARLELSTLLCDGPAEIRDTGTAESVLRRIVADAPEDAEAFDRLAALLSNGGRERDLSNLLEQRLAATPVTAAEHGPLTRQFVRLCLELGQDERALAALQRQAEDAGLDELRYQVLSRLGHSETCAALCRERALAGSDVELWRRRWLSALDAAPAGSDARSAALDALLAVDPEDPALHAERLALARSAGDASELAGALEAACAALDDTGRCRAWARELIDLYSGPLARPDLALGWIERVARDSDTALRARGARLAASLDLPEREAALLAPLAGADAPLPLLRRRALALAAAGREEEAEPLLWDVLARGGADAQVLETLERRASATDDRAARLRILEARYAIAPEELRAQFALDAVAWMGPEARADHVLPWLRRAADAGLGADELERWLELERLHGSPAQRLSALHAALARPELAERERWLAARAQLLASMGQYGLAAEDYRAAIRDPRDVPVEWLRAIEGCCEQLGLMAERIDWLRAIASRTDLPETERDVCAARCAELLATHPELREEAALELARLVGDGTGPADAAQLEREARLLDLYDELGRDIEWCRLAESRLAREEIPDRAALQRAHARRLTDVLGARDAAIAAWQQLLDTSPDDAEALEALLGLLRAPGHELQLAAALERHAESTNLPARWLEAAELRWHGLGDADAAFADVQRALGGDPELSGAHALRSELCERLNRPDEEAASLRTLLTAAPEGAATAERWLRLAQLESSQSGDAACDAARRALALASGNTELRRHARRVLERGGAWDEVVPLLREEAWTAELEDCPGLLQRLAEVAWEQCGNAQVTEEALEALASVSTLGAVDARRRAEACAALGDAAAALRWRRAALEAAGADASAEDWHELARALEAQGDAAAACEACDQAMSLDPTHVDTLVLRARVLRRLERPSAELEDRLRIAELLGEGPESAAAWCEAAEIAVGMLEDRGRGSVLYRSALRACATWLPALLDGGKLALATRDWSTAQDLLRRACEQLGHPDQADELCEVSRLAALAAEELGRSSEACAHLETGLAACPGDPETLDTLAGLSLRRGAHARALTCLEERLGDEDLSSIQRAERLVKLAQAAEADGALERAAAALEEALALEPADEVRRARLVDLLERLGDPGRAIDQLDAWIVHAPDEDASRLETRAALLEIDCERVEAARTRLSRVVERQDAPAQARVELARLALVGDTPEAALGVTQEARPHVQDGPDRAALAWIETQALHDLGRTRDAALTACETLQFDPTNIEAARLLAGQLGQVGDWARAAEQIQRALDATRAEPAIESELWESLGRAYAGPLEDIERAQRCYRRALDANPLRASAREALADTTAFDPAQHRESLTLHRGLLEAHPARPGSWRSLARIADHWRREDAIRTCSLVLEALGADLDPSAEPARGTPLADTNAPSSPVIHAAGEILDVVSECGRLPTAGVERRFSDAPEPLRREIIGIAGEAWDLDDADIVTLWRTTLDQGREAGSDLPRRPRKRLQRALENTDPAELRTIEASDWRAEVVGQAAARVIVAGELDLRETLLAVAAGWPATRHLDLRTGAQISAAIQACPAARSLLLRIADGAIDALGLG